MQSWISDAGDADFERAVLERSQQVPVMVDFWAPWCGPCQQLAPLLERLVEEFAGAFELVRVDIDQAVQVAQSLKVTSIPLLVVFRGGDPVGGLQGLQPEPALRELLARVLPSQADELCDRADVERSADQPETAARSYESALELEPAHPRALLGLAQLAADRGDSEQANAWLDRGLPEGPLEKDYQRLRAELRTQSGSSSVEEVRRRVATDDTTDARLELGRALVAAAEYEEALTTLLTVVERDPALRDAARQLMLDVFTLLPAGSELTAQFRRELGRVLFR